ncbi:MAG: hypothetical protein OXC91_02725 [Rhodobacteraceae bacterium]|nr:hypothetical protein [Paracoccaceae bacterium]
MKLDVEITSGCILQGTENEPNSCPVAIGMRRKGVLCEVHPCDIRFPDGTSVPTPTAVHDFVRRFDAGLPVEPFNFEIEVGDNNVGVPIGARGG